MAFRTDNAYTPAHPLAVAPQIADVKPLPQGDMIGSALLSAFVHRAIASEQANLEQQRNMQAADAEARRLELAKKSEADQYEVAKYNAQSLERYRASYNPGMRAKQATDDKIAKAQAYQTYQDTVEENDNRFDNAIKYEYPILVDAKKQAEDPVGWIQAYHDATNRFGSAVVGKVPRQLGALKAQADQMKVPFVHGAELVQDPATKSWGWTGANNGKIDQVPLEQIVRQWQNPQLRDSLSKGLVAAGHGSIVDVLEGKNVKKTPTLDKYTNDILLKAGKLEFNRGKNEVPEVLTRPTNTRVEQYGGGGAGDQSMGVESLPAEAPTTGISEEPDILPATNEDLGPLSGSLNQPRFTPTDTDQTLMHARNALAANPGAKPQIMSRLVAMGIPPDLLMGA